MNKAKSKKRFLNQKRDFYLPTTFHIDLLRAPLVTQFGMIAQKFFSETRRQKRSLAPLNEYFDNEVAGTCLAGKGRKEQASVKSWVFRDALKTMSGGKKFGICLRLETEPHVIQLMSKVPLLVQEKHT